MKPTIRPSKRQYQAWKALWDENVSYVIYGGAAGGGKTWLLCEWLITNCFFYPQTKWFIGRTELKRLLSSVYVTFWEVAAYHGVTSYFSYNGQMHYIRHHNGSQIDLIDLKYQPSDPRYERFGSLEYTGGAIEEGGEVAFPAFDILKSRVGRKLNSRYNLPGRILITCNPSKNWLYSEVYKPWRENELPPEYAFVQAYVTDNPYIDREYINNLRNLRDKSQKERLLNGNWEYDDDPTALMDFDAINDLFTNTFVESGKTYITADIARMGSDRAVIILWKGLRAEEIHVMDISTTVEQENVIKELAEKHQVPRSKIVIDEDGIGGGVVDHLSGVKGFVNNAQPMRGENYLNLKTQCYFLLSEKVNNQAIYIADDSHKEEIIEELEQIKQKDADKDGKLKIKGKEEVKEMLGRSPDFADALMMRMYFEHGINHDAFLNAMLY